MSSTAAPLDPADACIVCTVGHAGPQFVALPDGVDVETLSPGERRRYSEACMRAAAISALAFVELHGMAHARDRLCPMCRGVFDAVTTSEALAEARERLSSSSFSACTCTPNAHGHLSSCPKGKP